MDKIVALSYLVKMGGTQNQLLVQISKEIWEYLMDKGITITTEYLPGASTRRPTCSRELWRIQENGS